MKRVLNIVLLIFVFQSLYCYAQDNNYDKDLIKANRIKAQVIFEHEYEGQNPSKNGKKIQEIKFDQQGNKIEEVNYRFNGMVHYVVTSKYDSKGNRVEYIKFDGNKEKMVFRQLLQYNEAGKITTESGFNGVENYKTVFKYDNTKRLTEAAYYLDNKIDEKRTSTYTGMASITTVLSGTLQEQYKLNYKYDNKNRIIEEQKIEPGGVVSRVINYTYDSRNNVIQEERILNGKFASKTLRVYDNANRLTEVYNVDAQGKKTLMQKYIFDSKGHLTEESYRTQPNKDFSKNSYEYNENGMCISMESFYASYKTKVMYVNNYEKF